MLPASPPDEINLLSTGARERNVGSGSRLCENSDVQLACRTSISISSIWESIVLATSFGRRQLRNNSAHPSPKRVFTQPGSIATESGPLGHVRFTPVSDRPADIAGGPVRDMKRLMRRSKQHPYSITSSAVVSSDGGMVRPSVFAVFRLMTNSNFVGCTTGRSTGFSPLRIRPA
jgi:hypothetical protein